MTSIFSSKYFMECLINSFEINKYRVCIKSNETKLGRRNTLKILIQAIKILQNSTLGRCHTSANEFSTLERRLGSPFPEYPSDSASMPLGPLPRSHGGVFWGLSSFRGTGKSLPRLNWGLRRGWRKRCDAVQGQVVLDHGASVSRFIIIMKLPFGSNAWLQSVDSSLQSFYHPYT